MRNIITDINKLVHCLLSPFLNEKAIAVDATAGNGHDLLFLCQNCRYVYGFDIQEEALNNSEKLLQEKGLNNYELFLQSHDSIEEEIKGRVDIVMFNLGYLPEGDKSITTQAETVLRAVKQSLNKINDNGIVCLTLYPHPEGIREKALIGNYVRQLDRKRYHVLHISLDNQGEKTPEIIIVNKKEG